MFDHTDDYSGDVEGYASIVSGLARLAVMRNRSALEGQIATGMRRWLFDVAGGKCAMCGEAMSLDAPNSDPTQMQVCHVMSVLDSKRARTVGNVFGGCRACNLATGDRDLTPYLHLFADIFAIPVVFPTEGVFRDLAPKSDKLAEDRNRRNARNALGFDF